MGIKQHSCCIYKKYVKRPLDFMLSLLAIIFLSPILLVIALLIHIKLGSPVIFHQKRIGLNEKEFNILKFRTMTDQKDADGNLLPDEERLTRFGRKLRSTSLDELPSLLNILRGDMSIIGPRPLPDFYLPYYTEKEHHRHDVRPGLTGLAQINGRNYVSWEDKFAMDLDYVSHITFIKDVKLIFQTIGIVIKHEDIETGSFIEKDGVIYRPLNIERGNQQ